MIIDGKQIAQELQNELRIIIAQKAVSLSLRVFILQKDPATEQFIRIKKRVGESLGVTVELEELPEETTTKELIERIQSASLINNGIIIQLPLPQEINTDAVLAALPWDKDVDVIGSDAQALVHSGKSHVLPPVVAAMKEIVDRNEYAISGKKVVIVGEGRLVGKPAALWCTSQGATVTVLTEESGDLKEYTQAADVIVLGAGHAGLLKPDMIKEGVVILDAGTSETEGKVLGDVDPACAEKALLFTPVPGGIGPIAVTMIFKNLLTLNSYDN